MGLVKVTALQKDWPMDSYIEVYVKLKSNIKVTNNGKRCIYMILCDDTGEIKATVYDHFCDQYYNVLQENQKYRLSGGFVRPANGFVNLAHNFMIIFQNWMTVEMLVSSSTAPKCIYNFTSLSDVLNAEVGSFVDIVGVITAVGELEQSEGKLYRTVRLIDDSTIQIDLRLARSDAENFEKEANLHQVMVLKDAKIKNFDENIYVSSQDFFFINLDVERVNELKYWYMVFREKWVTVYDVMRSDSGEGICLGTVTDVSSNSHVYKACTNCATKLGNPEKGLYKCKKCNRITKKFNKGLLLRMKIADATEELQASAFCDVAESMLGKKASHLCVLALIDDDKFSRLLQSLRFRSFVFHLRRKDGEAVVVNARPMDCKEVATKIITSIKANKFGTILK